MVYILGEKKQLAVKPLSTSFSGAHRESPRAVFTATQQALEKELFL